ncbi:MAG: PDZ domain-containing protein [Chloroflexi bacterium]|nr:PDZ domain-containing protein [Chloroflexota bacterium]
MLKKLLFISSVLLLLAACGGGSGEPAPAPTNPPEAAPTEAPPVEEPTAPPEEPTAPPEEAAAPAGAVTSLEDVKSAVIQIEAEGTFRDPEQGLLMNAAGRGSGFIIDPSGIAVTNNHVVAGAALLKVWVGGESEPRNAKILGVSECSDLAVIDIEGDGYPYLTWYDGPLSVGLDVYAAGFPLGDPEYTLTRGIISKERSDGETGWASVDYVIQHDATINPGNSGGPLVTADGQLVGVNYAGASGVDQYFSIAHDEAIQITDLLRQGQDYESIGINGRAIADPESNLYGIWVSSVESGTPADKAGVEPGDIITQLEGLVLSTDGTMSDYCDILRTRDATDTMAIEVLRYDTQEVLAGQLNGDPLAQRYSFAQELQDEVAAEPAGDAGSSAVPQSYTYRTITDDSGLLVLDVPEQWSDVDGSAWAVDGEAIGVSVKAAPNLNDFDNTWTTPGVFFAASASVAEQMSVNDVLDAFDFSADCEYKGRTDYSDEVFAGVYDLWSNCGGQGSTLLTLSAQPQTQDFTVLVVTRIVSDADLEALDYILNSFNVVSGE